MTNLLSRLFANRDHRYERNLVLTFANIARMRGFYLDATETEKLVTGWRIRCKLMTPSGKWTTRDITWPASGNIWDEPQKAFDALLTRLDDGAS